MDVTELPALPAAGPLYRRAAIGLVPRPGRPRRPMTLPDVELTVRGCAVDRDRLADYDRVCGFRLTDALPATFPHIMAFPVALRLMTAADFPFPLVGLVHLANRITVHRPIDAAERLDLSVRAADLRPHPRGRQLDVIATASVGGAVVWRGVSTYLSRERAAGGGERRDQGDRPAPPAPSARWRVERRTGTDYARVSGDHNPIHTSRLGARLLGFGAPIAHGMWSKARCLAALEGRLPDAYTVEVAFKVPLPLPSTVEFGAARTPVGAGWAFGLHAARSGRPHLAGTIAATPAPAAHPGP
ncbi:MaoC/PaaZ C-terminal domain-containing protein [Solwaraspora sp. WMMD1047]|uniref:MaoC/PaaZ C-terminal domain-containing protein n=1 Tax=Solwaraspora sp. WMMD1047 TaxID=3016102 RepID=UPI00241725B9|nr:MaoC/PaaZ C-terminal domain-containing protein [Solwaraspora sp. WMMD1047]MDG4834503.1 MaoC/PaaZ C-terminal domain-containing protein [Solwaraspora sp. WMMD1047]